MATNDILRKGDVRSVCNYLVSQVTLFKDLTKESYVYHIDGSSLRAAWSSIGKCGSSGKVVFLTQEQVDNNCLLDLHLSNASASLGEKCSVSVVYIVEVG